MEFFTKLAEKVDTYFNKCRKLGTSKDVTGLNVEILTREYLFALYTADGIAGKIVDIKTHDMVREWIDIPEDTDGLILDRLSDLDAIKVFSKAIKFNKIFGGSVILMGIDDGLDFQLPVNIDNIRTIRGLQPFKRERIRILSQNELEQPEILELTNNDGRTINVHVSRCLIFTGELSLEEESIFQDMEFWGFSEYQGMFNILGKLGLSLQSIFDLLIQSNIDVLSMKDLWRKLDRKNKEGEKQIKKRLEILDIGKSISNTLLIDAEETYEVKAKNFTGVSDAMAKIQEFLSLVSGIPVTNLFSIAPKGLSATGDNELRMYYDKIKFQQRLDLEKPINKLNRYIVAAKEYQIPQDLAGAKAVFNALWQQTEKEKVDTRKVQADTDNIYLNNAVVDPQEIRDSRFGGGKYSPETIVEGDLPDIPTDEENENNREN